MMTERPRPRLSLVIPAYNEEPFLPRLLDSVEAAAQRYAHGAAAVQVIVADNASTDRTAELARERGCNVVPVAKRAIAAARNAGFAAARGEIVGFVDADVQIHPGTFDAIDTALRLAAYLGTTAQFWLNVQDAWDLWHELKRGSRAYLAIRQPRAVRAAARAMSAGGT